MPIFRWTLYQKTVLNDIITVMDQNRKRVCIVRLSALGDIINSVIVAKQIKMQLGNCSLEWVVDEQFAELLELVDSIDVIHSVALKKIKKSRSLPLLYGEIKKLRSLGEFDQIIDMQGLLKSAIIARLIGKNVHGFDAESAREGLSSNFYTTHSSIAYEVNIIRRNCSLIGDALDISIDDKMIENKEPIFESETYKESGYIVIVVGASWLSKRYPATKLIEVCNELPLPTLLVCGSQDERATAKQIASNSPKSRLLDELSLKELCSVISGAKLVIGGDTGPTHLAWAQNIPSITLYGPTTPRMMFQTQHNIAIESDSSVDILEIDKEDMSIKDIEPKLVVKRSLELL